MLGSCSKKRASEDGPKISWDHLRIWEELRRSEKSLADLRNMRRHEMSWHELRRAEKSRDEMRWDGWDWWKTLRKHDMRWGGMTQTAVTMGCNEQFPREAAMRRNQVRWEKIQPWKEMAPESKAKRLLRKVWPHPIGTVFAPLYRFYRWNLRRPYKQIICQQYTTVEMHGKCRHIGTKVLKWLGPKVNHDDIIWLSYDYQW